MRLAKFVKFREEKFGGVLFETRSEKVFTLNPTATAVVREIQAGGDERAIVGRLRERFDDRSGALEREVGGLIADREDTLRVLRRSGVETIDADARTLSPRLVNRYLDLKRRARL